MAGVGGVNTLPSYRRSGCIRRCFETILPQLHAQGCEFSYLYPFSTGYYLQFGYERCVQLLRAKVDLLQLKLPKAEGFFRLAEQRNLMLEAVQAVDRVIHARKVLEKAKYIGSGHATLQINDPLIQGNNRCFAVSFANDKAVRVEETEESPDAVLSIGAFSALITGVWDMADIPWLDGIEIRNPAPPLSQVFYKKTLMITDLF